MNTQVKQVIRMRRGHGSQASRAAGKSQEIRSYAELQERLHRDLLAQHPEWIEHDGNCPKCDEYDRRFAELISIFQSASRAA
jgi:hypothetical protein